METKPFDTHEDGRYIPVRPKVRGASLYASWPLMMFCIVAVNTSALLGWRATVGGLVGTIGLGFSQWWRERVMDN